MGEIKFRAFHYGMRYLTKPEDFSYFFGGSDGPERTLTECKLMQYTGMKDKNDKEVYEGDIIIGKFPYASKGVISWDDKRCGFYIKPIDGLMKAAYDKGYKMNSAKLEILGNIHENLELLNT